MEYQTLTGMGCRSAQFAKNGWRDSNLGSTYLKDLTKHAAVFYL